MEDSKNNQEKGSRSEAMGKEPVWRLLFHFSGPALVSMTVASTYNLVDAIFVGRLGADALAAIVGKLAMQYFSGPSYITSRFIDISIITSAHLSGAITGGLTTCFIAFTQKQTGGLAAAPSAQQHA